MNTVTYLLVRALVVPCIALGLIGSSAVDHAAATLYDEHWPLLGLVIAVAIVAAGVLLVLCQIEEGRARR